MKYRFFNSLEEVLQTIIKPRTDEFRWALALYIFFLIVKKYLGLIGLDNSQYSAHSLRSGFATSTAASGADERSIMAMTGHKSTEMVRRYIKEANLFKNNALDKINV